jgi:SAM-dependent methyltransferase
MKQDEIIKFWQKEGTKHLIPSTGEQFPEGWDVRPYLESLFPQKGKIIEVGCGNGRLSLSFDFARYLGLDVNPTAIEEAQKLYPQYTFKFIQPHEQLPFSEFKFVYTVLLHVSDEAIEGMVNSLVESSSEVLVAEIMGRKWRRAGNPPVFNREVDEYIQLFEAYGCKVIHQEERPYKRYKNTNITFIKFACPPPI